MENSIDTKNNNNARDGVTQIGKEARADAHAAVDRVADKVAPTAERLAATAHTGIDKVVDSAKAVSGSVSSTVDSVSERVAARSKQVGESYKKLAETGRSQVRASPAISVLIAAAAGYGISKLLSSRK